MDSSGIIPDVIDSKPAAVLEITYPGGIKVEMGKELTPTQVKDQPKVTWEATEDDDLYTLLMTDIDAPSRKNPIYREVLHWLVINVPGNKVDDGKLVAEYRPSGPQEGTGLHRYAFFVFKQGGKITIEKYIEKDNRDARLNFKTRDYITKYKLSNPIAGNFYEAQYDDYVKTLK